MAEAPLVALRLRLGDAAEGPREMMRLSVTCALALLLAANGASAANDFGLSKRDSNAPIQVSADRFDAENSRELHTRREALTGE